MANPSFESSSPIAASGGLTTATTTLNTTTGRLLVAWIASYNQTATITDSLGNTWVAGPSYTAGLGRMRMYYCLSCIGGTGHQFTATTPVGDYPTITVQQYNWNGSVGTFDQSNNDFISGASTAHSTGNITTNNAGALLVAGGSTPSVTSYSVDSPFTQDRMLATGSMEGIVTGYRIPGSTGTYDCDITTSVSVSLRSIIASFYPAGGGATQFDISVGGAMTPAGALLRQPNKAFTGALTPAGALLKEVRRIFAGAMTPVGALARQIQKLFAGSVAPSGALANIKTILMSFAGTVASSGALVRSVGKGFAGAITPVGAIVRQVQKAFAGVMAPSGALANVKTVLLALAGAVASSGALIKSAGKALAGTVTLAGGIVRQSQMNFAGTVAPSGSSWKAAQAYFAGTITCAGALANQIIGPGQMFRPTLNFVMTIVKVLKKQGS